MAQKDIRMHGLRKTVVKNLVTRSWMLSGKARRFDEGGDLRRRSGGDKETRHCEFYKADARQAFAGAMEMMQTMMKPLRGRRTVSQKLRNHWQADSSMMRQTFLKELQKQLE